MGYKYYKAEKENIEVNYVKYGRILLKVHFRYFPQLHNILSCVIYFYPHSIDWNFKKIPPKVRNQLSSMQW